jgi:hypothetical protein
MSSGRISTNIGQNNSDPTMNGPYFLSHELEPIDNYRSFAPNEIKEELYENRFFLKRRVWRNMRKIRRHPQIQYRFTGPENKKLRPRYIG